MEAMTIELVNQTLNATMWRKSITQITKSTELHYMSSQRCHRIKRVWAMTTNQLHCRGISLLPVKQNTFCFCPIATRHPSSLVEFALVRMGSQKISFDVSHIVISTSNQSLRLSIAFSKYVTLRPASEEVYFFPVPLNLLCFYVRRANVLNCFFEITILAKTIQWNSDWAKISWRICLNEGNLFYFESNCLQS